MIHSIKIGLVTTLLFIGGFFLLCLPHMLGLPDGIAAVLGPSLMMGLAAVVGSRLT